MAARVYGREEGRSPTGGDVRGWPTTYVLDHRGVIRYKGLADKQLDAAVEILLKELEAAKAGQFDTRP